MHLVQANTNNVHLLRGKFDSPNQKPYPDLGSDMSSVWNLCVCFSDITSPGKPNVGCFLRVHVLVNFVH